MPKPLAPFQPGIDTPNAPDGVSYLITSPQVSPCAVVEMHNNSPYQFKVYGMPGMAYLGLMPINAQTGFTLKPIYQQLQFMPTVAVNKSAAPLANVAGDLYEQEEADDAELSTIPMPQQTNVGNAVSTTNVTSVSNLSGSPGQSIVEAALSGNPVQVDIGVDGTVSISVISNNVLTQVFQITPGDATHAATVELHGVADSANSVPASGVTGSLPASQISGTLPASQVGSGYPGADVTGAVASATEATSANAVNADSNTSTQVTEHVSGAAPNYFSVHITPNKGNTDTTAAAVRIWNDGASSDVTYANFDSSGNPGIPPASLNNGAIPSGVTISASQISGTLPASQVGTGYPGGDVTGAVASASSANALNLDNNTSTQFTGHTAATNYATMITPQPASTPQHMSFRTWDGTASHDTDTIAPGGGINTTNLASGTLPSGVVVVSHTNLDGSPIPLAGGKTLTGWQRLTLSSSGTYSHGIGATPNGVLCNADNGSNSTTFGSGSYTSTTVFVYVFSSMASIALVFLGG